MTPTAESISPTPRQDRKSLVHSQEIYHRFFEFAPDAILVVDRKGIIIQVNAQAEKMFGYSRSELLGQFVEILIPNRFAADHAAHRLKYLDGPRTRSMGAGVELFGRRKDNTEFPMDIMLSPLQTDDGAIVLAVFPDISERKQAEQRAIELREKEVLLKEIHHRVKNNLAVIASLFYLESTYTQDEQTIKILQEAQNRVRSMILVHETLYRSENSAALEFAEYAQELTAHVFRTHGLASGAIRLRTDIERVRMSIDTAVACGLILNELISNALKHAFPNGQGGEIVLRLHRKPDSACELQVSDNGVGLSRNPDLLAGRSLGLRLVHSLARQLDGQFQLIPKNPGIEARLIFQVRQ